MPDKKKFKWMPWSIALVYTIIGGIWILFSDRFVGFIANNDPERILNLSTFKGWFYVVFTAVLLYFMMKQLYTGLLRSEKITKLTEEKYTITLGLLPDAIAIIHTESDRYIEVNDGFCRLLGCVRNDVLGKTGIQLNIWGSQDDRFVIMKLLSDKGSFKDFELNARKMNGQMMTVLLSGSQVNSDDGGYTVYSAVDITKIKNLEIEALNRSAELLEANMELKKTNEDLEFFAHSSYHDLREPLRQISLQIEYLQNKLKLSDPEDIKTFGYIRDGAIKMDALLNFIRNYTAIRKSKYPVVNVNLNECAENAVSDLHEEIEKSRADIVISKLPETSGSRELYADVFKNLISNAIKYNKNKPEIRIYAEGATICVADNGIGVEPQYRDKVFVLFERLHTNTEYSGTGVGLAICKKIVELYGGKIAISKGPTGGSVVTFTVV